MTSTTVAHSVADVAVRAGDLKVGNSGWLNVAFDAERLIYDFLMPWDIGAVFLTSKTMSARAVRYLRAMQRLSFMVHVKINDTITAPLERFTPRLNATPPLAVVSFLANCHQLERFGFIRLSYENVTHLASSRLLSTLLTAEKLPAFDQLVRCRRQAKH